MGAMALGERLRLGAILAGHQARALLGGIYASPVYRWRYSGPTPERLTVAPQDLRTADPTVAAEIYSGRYSLAGHTIETAGRSPFEIDPPSRAWNQALHGFGWLRHLRAADTELARIHAQSLIEDWLNGFGSWNRPAWEPEVTARRLISWLSHSPLILRGAEMAYYRRFLRSLARQARYLHHTAADAGDGAQRLSCAIALAYAGLCLAGQTRLFRHACRWLDEELERQVLPDGGHISRNPAVIIDLLLDLLPLRQTFLACDVPPSGALMSAIDRMMPMLRFFRHPDGAMAHFNGMGASRADLLATLFAYDDVRGAPASYAPHSGYQRLEAGDAVLIMDAGPSPPPTVSCEAHAGCLSFELSLDGTRLIVNCGAPAASVPHWRSAARATAAHSTAVIDDTSSARFAASPWVCRRIGAVVLSGPRDVRVERHEHEGPSIDASHDGYLASFGIIHERRIALSAQGDRVDGEDLFHSSADLKADADPAYAIRFHLHPAVRASVTRDGERAVLLTPRDAAWEFSAEGARLTIEESVYLGALDGPRRAEQIVLHGRCRAAPAVRWRLQRLTRARRRGASHSTDAEELPLATPGADRA